MESESLKLSLNLSPPWRIEDQNNNNPDTSSSSELRDYIGRLEHELRKIESFKRELPLSVLLLTNAIGRLKEEVGKSDKEQVQVKTACDLNEIPQPQAGSRSEITGAVDGDKKAWMRSAQLWSSDQTSFLQLSSRRTGEVIVQRRTGEAVEDKSGAFSSITEGSEISPAGEDADRSKLALTAPPPLCLKVQSSEPSSGLKIGGGGGRNSFVPILPDQNKLRYQASPAVSLSSTMQGSKKHRRCWSPELHRRFIDALEKLGGSQVATPKQIRDLMQVNGLTNDEVKSHLQKYRLHIRKLPNSKASSSMAKLCSSHDSHLDCSVGGEATGSKAETSQSGSPQGPLHMAIRSAKCNSAASRCHSIEEDGEEKSDSHSWGGDH